MTMTLYTSSTPGRTVANARGLSLIETVVATLIVAGLFVAALNSVAATRGTQIHTSDRVVAQLLAEELMAEILAQPFTTADAPSLTQASENQAGTRASYDAVAYYNGWRGSPPQVRSGEAIAGYERFTRTVEVAHIDPSNPSTTSTTATGIKRIVVHVYRDEMPVAKLVAVRSNAWRQPGPHDRHRLP